MSTHATLKTVIHAQLMPCIYSTADTNTVTSMTLWSYLNTLTFHPSYSHTSKCTYNCFMRTIILSRNNNRTNMTWCFSYFITITECYNHHNTALSSQLSCTIHSTLQSITQPQYTHDTDANARHRPGLY
jgi:hypothetical protein